MKPLKNIKIPDKWLNIIEQLIIAFIFVWILIALARLNYDSKDPAYKIRDRFYFIGDKLKDFIVVLFISYLKRKSEIALTWLSLAGFFLFRLAVQIYAACIGMNPNDKVAQAAIFIVLMLAIIVITTYQQRKILWHTYLHYLEKLKKIWHTLKRLG